MEEFESNHDFDDLRDPIIPPCFLFVFNSFLEIFNCSGEHITWTDINSYAILRKIEFKQFEIDYLMKCINWANSKISEMRDSKDINEDN